MLEGKSFKNFDGKWKILRICDCCGIKEEVSPSQAIKRYKEGKPTLCWPCANKSRNFLAVGEKNGHWKHGLNKQGYKRINIGGNRILEHKHVMERFLGRCLSSEEIVHHIDMDKENNSIKNLWLCKSNSDHRFLHHSMERIGYSLLARQIFFNERQNVYCLTKCEITKKSTDLIVKAQQEKFPCQASQESLTNQYVFYGDKWRKLQYRRDPRGYKNSYYAYFETGSGIRLSLHVAIAESRLGRPLFKDECVHHIDGNGLNNDPDNLSIMKKRQHAACHYSLQKCVAELYKRGQIRFDNGQYLLNS